MGGTLRLVLMGLWWDPGLLSLEKEALPTAVPATAWEMPDQGGDDSQDNPPGSHGAIR